MCDELDRLNIDFLMAAYAHVNAEYELRKRPPGTLDLDVCKQKVQDAEAVYFRARSLVINHRLQHACSLPDA